MGFSLATRHGWGTSAIVTWVDVTLYGPAGESLARLAAEREGGKGRELIIRGELWVEERGGKRFVKLRGDTFELCGPAPGKGVSNPLRADQESIDAQDPIGSGRPR